MKISARFSYDSFRHDQTTDAHLVVSLTAPARDGEATRQAICVVPVIDVSGSMSGAKLDYAKRSAIKLIEHLKTGDYCGVIAFGSDVYVVAEPTRIDGDAKERLKAEVGKLGIRGSTNFAGGLLKAIELVDKLDLPATVIQRIIMFTDGQANVGVATKPEELTRLLEANMGRSTVSAFGYGQDVSQQLLTDFARIGKGNYAYIDQPDAALSAFGMELGGLLSTYGTDIVLDLTPLQGHRVTQVVTDVEAEIETIGGDVEVKIPSILGEETRHLVFAVKLEEQKQAFPRSVNTFDVKVRYDTINAAGKRETLTLETKAKTKFVKAGDEATKPNADLDAVIGLAQLVRAQIAAEASASRGDYVAAQNAIGEVQHDVRRRGLGGVLRAATALGEKYASPAAYAGSENYRVGMRSGGTRGMGVMSLDASLHADLAETGAVSFTNSTMEKTASSFTGGDPQPGVPMVSVDSAVPAAQPDLSSWVQIMAGSVAPAQPGITVNPILIASDATPLPTKTERRTLKQPKSSTRW